MGAPLRISFRSRLKKLVSHKPLELIELERRREPIFFPWLEKDDNGTFYYGDQRIIAEEWGPEREIGHPTFHEIMTYAVLWDLTRASLLDPNYKGANGIVVVEDNYKVLSDNYAITAYQPIKIREDQLGILSKIYERETF